MEGVLEARLVLIGPRTDEVDDLAVVIRSQLVVAARLVDHPQSIVAVVDFGEAHEQVTRGVFGFIELASTNHRDDGVRGLGELLEVVIDVVREQIGERGSGWGFRLRRFDRGPRGALGGFVLFLAAALVFLPAAAVARIVASDLDLGHRGGILPSWSADVDQAIEEILSDTRFYELLLGIDRQIADAARALPCRECRAKLHWGSFARKPRGVPAGLGPEHLRRFSLCCAGDGCRTRETPSSVRFLGRKVFLGAMVVLISAMQSGLTPARMKRLKALVGVSRRTVLRWRDWWHRVFTESPFWRAHRALAPTASTANLPASLLESFEGTIERQLISLLRFLAPITTGHGILRAI
jgi:hypothetical protein